MTILELMVDANIDFLRRPGIHIDARTQEILQRRAAISVVDVRLEKSRLPSRSGSSSGRVVKTDTCPVAEFVECGKAETGRETIRFDLEITVIRVRIAAGSGRLKTDFFCVKLV